MMRIPNTFTLPKYIDCSAKHISDRAKILIRRSSIFQKALSSRANRTPNALNFDFA